MAYPAVLMATFAMGGSAVPDAGESAGNGRACGGRVHVIRRCESGAQSLTALVRLCAGWTANQHDHQRDQR